MTSIQSGAQGSHDLTVSDRLGRSYRLSISLESDRYCLRLHAGRCCIGQAKCSWGKGRVMHLDDIGIANEMVPPFQLWNRLVSWGAPAKPVSYRGLGLGTALLEQTIAHAMRLGAVALVGEVFQPDVDNMPGLLDWYKRLGFEPKPTTAAVDPTVDQIAEIYLDLRLREPFVSSLIH